MITWLVTSLVLVPLPAQQPPAQQPAAQKQPAQRAAAQPSALPTLVSTEAVQLVWEDGALGAHIPLVVDTSTVVITPLVVEVRLGAKQRPPNTLALEVQRRKDAPGLADLVVTAPHARLEGGEWSLQLRFRVGRATSELVPLKLIHEEPALAADKLLFVTHANWPGETVRTLSLSSPGRGVPVSKIGTTHAIPKLADGADSEGQLTCATLDELGSGGVAHVPCRITSPFELGTVTGALRINAANRAAPLDVPFEVRTRRHPWVLLLFLALGLGLGFYVRRILEPRLAQGRSGLALAKLRQEVFELAERHPDEAMRAAAAIALAAIARAQDDGTPAALDAASAEVKRVIEEARSKLSTARDALVPRLTDALGALAQPRILDPVVDHAVRAARTTAKRAEERLAAGDVTGAERELRATFVAASQSMTSWSRDRDVQLRSRLAAHGAIADLPATAEPISPLVISSGQELALALDSASASDVKLGEALDRPLRAFAREAFPAHATLVASGLLRPETTTSFGASRLALERALEKPPMPSEQLAEDGALRVAKTLAAWLERAVLEVAAKRGFTEAEVTALQPKLTAGAWRDAVAAVTKAPKAQGSAPDAAANAAAAAAAEATVPEPRAPQPNERVELVQPIPRDVLVDVPKLEALVRRTSLGLSLAAAFALLVIGYFIFADTFVGTGRDLLAAFLWAFTTDVGFGAVLTLATQLVPKAPSP
ncbi:hypothetical protein L6R52_06660 [Myxococcota bacterium]|nr:hypothetical protein [Myxococcota bacterium]